MINNLIFSIGIAMPIFLVMFTGHILIRIGLINEDFVKASNKMIFNVALPIKIFYDMVNTSFQEAFDVRLVFFVVIGIITSMVLAWLVGIVILKEKSQLGAFTQGSFRGNYMYVGYSLLENMTGSIGAKAPIMLAFIMPLYNILGVLILALTKGRKISKESVKEIFFSIIKNPLIIAIFIGLFAGQVGLKLPLVISRTMGYFRELVTPLALLTIGATFSFQKSSKNLLPSVYASILKLIIIPIIALYIGMQMGFTNTDLLLIYVIFGVPTSTVSYIITVSLEGDGDLASNIIMTTTILSVLSMTLFVFIFKTIGLI